MTAIPTVTQYTVGKRECGLMIPVASQGVGKSHANKLLICEYVKDKLATKVKGRKVLIFDPNGEYSPEGFGTEGIPALNIKRIAVKDVEKWCLSPIVEVRRLDLKPLNMDEKFIVLNYVIEVVRGCLFLIEDINKTVLDVAHIKRIVGTIVGLRHRGVDVIAPYQALRDVPPRFLSNCKYVRMHYFAGDSQDVKGKLTEPEVYKIAQIIVNTRYYLAVSAFKNKQIDETEYKRRRSFHVYVYTDPHKIEGPFSKIEFSDAVKKYLRINKKIINDEVEMAGISVNDAIVYKTDQLINQYYGNEK